LPGKTSTATGRPSAAQSGPNTVRRLPLLPSRLCPEAASRQRCPSRQGPLTSYRISVFSPSRCRPARLRPVQGWRPGSQPGMPGIPLPVTGPGPGRAPGPRVAVPGDSRRAVAGLEPGDSTLETTAPGARSRPRLRVRWSMRPGPGIRAVPGTAAAWPCGRERSTCMSPPMSPAATAPPGTARKPSTVPGGSSGRLATVRLRIRLPSRQASRRRMAGLPAWLGTDPMLKAMAASVMGTRCAH